MVHLRLLGATQIDGPPSDEAASVLVQPKRLALLAWIALIPPGEFRRRDVAAALFWPESDAEHARASLRQAIRFLRKRLGDGVLTVRGDDELAAGPTLRCDATDFLAAAAAGDVEAAALLYRGELLAGFHVTGAAQEFNDWIEGQRAVVRRDAISVLTALADRRAGAGDYDGAVREARRAVALAPDDESSWRRLMTLLDAAGDRGGALEAHDELVRRLATEYDAEPSEATRALGAALRARAPPPPRPTLVAAAGAAAGAVVVPAPAATAPVRPSPVRGRPFVAGVVATLGVILAVGVGAVVLGLRTVSHPPAPPLDPHRVAVLPFRVRAADSTLGYLREGLVDLIAAKLTGAGGLEAVDPTTTLREWRRAAGGNEADLAEPEARLVAGRLGAGRVLSGTLVGDRTRLELHASLADVAPGGGPGGTRRSVVLAGRPESLPALVDRLTRELLVRAAGEDETRLADLTTRSLPALRAYLEAQAAYRRGAYPDAYREFGRALALDSIFALAGLGLAAASGYWGDPDGLAGRGLAVAWAGQARLGPRDRELLRFVAEPSYPEQATLFEKIVNWDSAATRLPERIEVWFQLGDNLLHWGDLLGLPDARRQAANAFDRALALDSTFAPALDHRIWLAGFDGDTATVRRLGARLLRADTVAGRVEGARWRIAVALGDGATLAAVRARLATLPEPALAEIAQEAQQARVMLADAESALAVLVARSDVMEQRYFWLVRRHDLALNRGRPALAAAIAQRAIASEDPDWTDSQGRLFLYDALYWDGDSASAAAMAATLAARVARMPSADQSARRREFYDLCVLAQHRLALGDSASARRAVAVLRASSAPRDLPADVAENRICAALIETGLATREGRPGRAADRLDSLLTYGPWIYDLVREAAILTLAAAREAEGRPDQALAAVRRRVRGLVQPRYLTTLLRAEGRLAAALGDSNGARRAYAHYVALRADPEPPLRGEVARVGERLRALGPAAPGARSAPDLASLLLKGDYLMQRRRPETIREARAVFSRAVELDPLSADAWARLGAAYGAAVHYELMPGPEGFPRAEAAARRALRLDSTHALALTTLAEAYNGGHWNWAEAERLFRRAIAADPGDAESHIVFGVFLRSRGRYDEAHAEMVAAARVDPLARHYPQQAGRVLLCAGRHAEAIAAFRRALEIEDYPTPHLGMAEAYAGSGRFAEASAEWRRAALLDGDSALADVLRVPGRASYQAALRLSARRTVDASRLAEPERYRSPVAVAAAYVTLGRPDSAARYTERAFAERDIKAFHARCFAETAPLLRNPHFVRLARAAGLGP
jgi:serine/threonine-protein kinase